MLSTIQQKAQNNDLAPLFGDFSQCEKLSEIKPPLGKPQMHKDTNYLFKIWFSTHCAKYCSDNTNCYEDELHCSSL